MRKYIRNGGRRRPGTLRMSVPQTVRLNMSGFGVGGGITTMSGYASSYGCRVATITDPVLLSQFKLTAMFAGLWQTVSAAAVRGGGDDGEGTIFGIDFPGEADGAAPWNIVVPADKYWLEARDGGWPGAVMAGGSPLTPSPLGWLQFASDNAPVSSLPGLWLPLMWQALSLNSVLFTTRMGLPLAGPVPEDVVIGGNAMNILNYMGSGMYEVGSNVDAVLPGMDVAVAAWLPGWREEDGGWMAPVRSFVTA